MILLRTKRNSSNESPRPPSKDSVSGNQSVFRQDSIVLNDAVVLNHHIVFQNTILPHSYTITNQVSLDDSLRPYNGVFSNSDGSKLGTELVLES